MASIPRLEPFPKSKSIPTTSQPVARASKAMPHRGRVFRSFGASRASRAKISVGTVISSPQLRASNPKPKKASFQLASNPSGTLNPGSSSKLSQLPEAMRSIISGRNQAIASKVVDSSGTILLGRTTAVIATSTSNTAPRTGELAAIMASKMAAIPT